jgi:hypothetical protein
MEKKKGLLCANIFDVMYDDAAKSPMFSVISIFDLNIPSPPDPLSHALRGRGGATNQAFGTDPSPSGRGDQGVRVMNRRAL